MEQSPWEAKQFSDSQEIPCMFWNQKVQYRIHKCLPPVPILIYRVQHLMLPILIVG